MQQYVKINYIVQAACEVGGITYAEFIRKDKSLHKNVLRGVTCVMSRYCCVHPRITALIICRSRQNVINIARSYHKYLQARDELTTEIYKKINDRVNEYELQS